MVADTTIGTDALILPGLRNGTGESPVWEAATRRWLWVDIPGGTVFRLDPASGALQRWQLPEQLGCLVLRPDGGVVCSGESGLFDVDLAEGPGGEAAPPVLRRLADVAHPQPGMRFNDGRCDRQGRFWAGTMVRDMSLAAPAGVLHRLDARGLSAPLLEGLITPNGMAFSPDGRTMYLSDSHPSVQRIWRFELDAEGTPAERREFVDMNRFPGRPDGAAVDAEGGYWICGNDGGAVHRFTPDGRLERSLAVPVSKPAMCAFGGPALEHLFITSITPAQPAAGFDAALDGAVFVAEPGVRGLAEQPFQP